MNLLESVRDAGIIGAGGAGFPTHAKLASKAEYLLLNGAECEPLLRVDQQLMAMYPDEIIKGFEAAARLVEAEHAIIGVKGKHKEVIALLRDRIKALGMDNYVEVGILPDIYPAGDEHVLVHELTGRVVPEMGIPIQAGCVVINAETTYNIYRASQGLPVTEKYVTLAGDVPERMTVKVPVGTPVAELLRLTGIENFDDYGVIDGGPMMGSVMSEIGGFVTKKNKGYIILKKDHYLIRKKSVSLEQARRVNRTACEQCRMCTDLCPRFLLGHNTQPHKMMRVLNYNLTDLEGQKAAQLCCQCGLCELFSCPAGLFPKSANIIFKNKLAEEGIKYQPEKTEFEPRSVRGHRLVPSKRLVARIGLRDFDRPAPMKDIEIKPDVVKIPTRQSVGAACQPVVNVGDYVAEGQMIGKIPENSLGAPIHASISGTVVECSTEYIAIRRG